MNEKKIMVTVRDGILSLDLIETMQKWTVFYCGTYETYVQIFKILCYVFTYVDHTVLP